MASAPELRKCDIVMKGDITSGVVYPRALEELSHAYHFQNIGGTSAGDTRPVQRGPFCNTANTMLRSRHVWIARTPLAETFRASGMP
jgi:hypothetical protein